MALHSLFSLLWFWLPVLGVGYIFWDMVLVDLLVVPASRQGGEFRPSENPPRAIINDLQRSTGWYPFRPLIRRVLGYLVGYPLLFFVVALGYFLGVLVDLWGRVRFILRASFSRIANKL